MHDPDLAAAVGHCLDLERVDLVPAAAGGASHVAYEVHDPARPGRPVAFLRCESGLAGTRYGLRHEAGMLAAARELGVPVADVLGTPGDPPGLLMNVVPGTSRPGPDEAEAVAPEYLALVARVHAADVYAFPSSSSRPSARPSATTSRGGRSTTSSTRAATQICSRSARCSTVARTVAPSRSRTRCAGSSRRSSSGSAPHTARRPN